MPDPVGLGEPYVAGACPGQDLQLMSQRENLELHSGGAADRRANGQGDREHNRHWEKLHRWVSIGLRGQRERDYWYAQAGPITCRLTPSGCRASSSSRIR